MCIRSPHRNMSELGQRLDCCGAAAKKLNLKCVAIVERDPNTQQCGALEALQTVRTALSQDSTRV